MAALIPKLTEQAVAEMLKNCLGRIDIAAFHLGYDIVDIDRMIRRSEMLQNVYMTCQAVVAEVDYERVSGEQIRNEVNRRLGLYQLDGIEQIHKIAMLPATEETPAGTLQVKLAAAARLAGGAGGPGASGSSLEDVLKQLNHEYQQASPRIKQIRERVVTFEDDPKVISDQ